MRLLALDLSLRHTGYTIVAGDPTAEVHVGVLNSPDHMRQGVRLLWIWRKINQVLSAVIGDELPNVWLIEDYAIMPGPGGKNVADTAQLHGAVKALAEQAGWPTPILVTPSQLKVMATGKGGGKKVDVIIAARERLGCMTTDDNMADARWLAEIGLHLIEHPFKTALPQQHVRALNALRVSV